MSLSKHDDQSRWCPAIACFQGFLFAAFRLLRYGACAFPSVILCDMPLSANQSKHRYVPKEEDDKEDRKYFSLEKCYRNTADGETCKTLKKCWSYESLEQCQSYYKDHLCESNNHRDLCTDEVDREIFAATPKVKVMLESYVDRERDRKYWENEEAKAVAQQRARELEAAKEQRAAAKPKTVAAKKTMLKEAKAAKPMPIKRELSPAAATAAAAKKHMVEEDPRYSAMIPVSRRALLGPKTGLEDISAGLQPQIQTIQKMERACRNCDEATKAAVAMIHKVLVDEGAKCSDMPRVLE